MGRLAGKVSLITGAARGQGAAEARLFAAEGAAVVITDVLEEPGEALAATLRSQGASASFHHLDVASSEQWRAALDHVRWAHGRLDVLINNAGVAQRNGLLDTPINEWDAVLRINLTGAFIGIQTVVELMGPGASIVNISSIAGAIGWRPPAYAASKWGLRGLTHSAALELAERGIRVNVILPGAIDTPFLEGRQTLVNALVDLTPIGRAGEASDVAKLALFLASDESSFITGSEFVIDGGFVTGAAAKELRRKVLSASE